MPEEPETTSAEAVPPPEPCAEAKQVLDACIKENGGENCAELIEAHKKCMRDLGFEV